MCELTKYLVVAPIPDKSANTVAKAVLNNLILVYGQVKYILTDRGTEYVNSVMKELCRDLGIDHKTSTPYHHQTMGTVERNHRVFNEYLRSYLTNDSDWEEWLKFFAYCYNTTPHSSFKCEYSPFELVHGRKGDLPKFTQSTAVDPVYNLDNYAKEARYRLHMTSKTAREMLLENKRRSKEFYDGGINPIVISVGDKVLVRNEAGQKHENVYKGPFTVIEINEPNLMIRDQYNKLKTIHKNNVNKCNF